MEEAMTMIKTGTIHHLALTVTDSKSSRDFYVNLLGFQVLAEFDATRILSNGRLVLVVKPTPDPANAPKDDRFDENRVGLDHLCLSVASIADLEKAMTTLDERGVPHGEIEDLGDMGICVLTLRDPDNIQIELSAPKN
jgi:catechol 2,3-dioxygenase-like lactoylglutathione lyase family enzyme